MTKHNRVPGRTKQEGTLAGTPNKSLTRPDSPEDHSIDLNQTALGPAGLSQALSEVIEAANSGSLAELSSEPYLLEEIVKPPSLNLKLQMDTLSIEDEYSAQIKYLKKHYSDITNATIKEVLNLDLKTYNQIPHALLAIAMLYGFNFDDENFFDNINKTQEDFSGQVVDKMEIFMRTRNKKGTFSLLQEIFYNYELASSQEVRASYFIR